MKKFLAVAAVLAIGSAHAEELKFGDLNYFLKQGQFNVAADVIVDNEAARFDKTDHNEIDAYLINTKFAYALSNQLNVTLGLKYIFNANHEVTVDPDAGGPLEPETRGFNIDALQNPEIGANFRVLNQDTAGFNFDLGAVAKIKVIDRKVGNIVPERDGNNASPFLSNKAEPRNTLDLNARLGKKTDEANEFYVTGGVAYHMDGEYKQRGNGTTDMDSSLDLKLGAFYQYRPVHEFMMTLGLTGTRFGEVKGDFDGDDFKAKSHIDTQFIFNAKYLISESFITKFTFTNDRREAYDLDQDSGNVEIDKRSGIAYGLGVDFLF